MDGLFESQTIVMRPFEAGYRPALQAYLNHPDLAGRRYVPWGYPELAPLSEDQVEQIIQEWNESKKGFHLAVIQRESSNLIGHIECDWEWDPHCPSISLVIGPPFQHRGYGGQVLQLQLGYLFDYTPAHTVTAWISDWNQDGLAFFSKHGFKNAGRMRRTGIHRGKYTDLVVMDILRREWLAGQGGRHGA